MRYDSIPDLFRAMTAGTVGHGDVVYVSADVYSAMSHATRLLLWDRVLSVRATLIPDFLGAEGIEVRRRPGLVEGGAGDAQTGPPPR